MSSQNKFITLSDFAAQVGVTAAAVSNWRSRNPKSFPFPVRPDDLPPDEVADDPQFVRALRRGRVFRQEELLAWARNYGRLGQVGVDSDLHTLSSIASKLADIEHPDRHEHRSAKAEWDSNRMLIEEYVLDALAIAAGRIYEQFVGNGPEWRAVPEVAPIVSVYRKYEGRGRSVVADLVRVTNFLQQRGTWSSTIDELQAEYAGLFGQRRWSETVELADVVGQVVEADPISRRSVRRLVDPCCGTGGLLALLARRRADQGLRRSDVQLVGREIDPLRAAIAHALLTAEGFAADISCGLPFDDGWLDQAATSRHPLVAVTLPRSGSSSSRPSVSPQSGETWVSLVADRLGPSCVVGATATKALWLQGRQHKPVASHEALLQSHRLLAVARPSSSSDSALVVVRSGEAERSRWPAGVALINLDGVELGGTAPVVSELVRQWVAGAPLGPELGQRAEIVDEATLIDRRSLLPPTPPAAVAPAAPTLRTPAPQGRSSGRRSDRPYLPASVIASISPGPGRPPMRTAERELPRAPLRTLNEIRRIMEHPADDLWTADDELEPARTLQDTVDDGEIVVVAPHDVEIQPGHLRLVRLTTSPVGFGHVDLVPVRLQLHQELHRGQVLFAVPFHAKDAKGLTPEFLAGWLSSLRVQRAMRGALDPERRRDTLSISKVLGLPGDFPDPDRCLEIAQRWAEYERVKDFAERLPEALTEWKLHLADEVGEPATED